MPTFRHGKNTVVAINGFDATTFFNDATSTRMIDTAETTAFGSTAKTYIASLRDGTLSLKGMYDGSTGAVDEVFAGIAGSTTDAVVTVGLEGSTVGTACHMVGAIETNYEVSAVVSDLVKISADFQGDGGLDSGKILQSGTISTATTTLGTAVDNTTSSANGGVGHVHATANTRSGTTQLKIQHSTDNSTWVDLVTFTGIATTITSGERIVLASGTTVNRYVRSNITTSGTGSITTSIAFARR